MHVEPPKAHLMSLSEFGLHYVMILLSILTAIGLEEGLRTYHDHEAAHTAQQTIERELLSNLSDLRDAMKLNHDRLDILQKLGNDLAEDIRHSQNAEALKKKLVEEYIPKLTIGLMLPSQSHQAWDVAVSSQAAVHIPRDKLEAYTAAYTIEHDALGGANSAMLLLDAPRVVDFQADAEIGFADPKRFLEVLREAKAINAVGLSNLTTAEQEMVKVLDKAGVH